MSRYDTIPLIVALSPGHSDITRFGPWSPITTRNHLNCTEKILKVAQTTGNIGVFWSAFRHFWIHFAESFRMYKSSWMMDLKHSREMYSSSAIGLAEIRRSSMISSWIWSIISGVVTVLGRQGRGASQVEKLPHLNWTTQLLTVTYDGAYSPNICQNSANFVRHLDLQEKRTWWQLASPCCWNRARHLTCFHSASVTRKDLQLGTWTDPSFQRHYRFRPMTSGSRSSLGFISTSS